MESSPIHSDELIARLSAMGIVPIIAIEQVQHAVPLADSLMAGGLPVAEITFRTAAAETSMRILARQRPEVLLGAGTVLSREQLLRAHAAGARFAVSPGLNADVVRQAQDLGMPFFPGVSTPSEIEQAMSLGCECVKLFPAELLGGIAYIRALAGPYQHTGLRVLPAGGVNAENLADYLRAPMVAAIGGTWIAAKDDLARQDWAAITARCRAAMDTVAAARRG